MEPTIQNAELAAYVVGAVQIIKPLVKMYFPQQFHTPLLVLFSVFAGAMINGGMYGFTEDVLASGALVGAVASGAFGATKEVLKKD